MKFKTGRYERGWVDNVLAIGNAGGFVEPLESSGLMMVCLQMQAFVELIQNPGISPSVQKFYNQRSAAAWDEVRDFLTLHFWVNNRLDTPYWQHCRADTDISRLAPLLEFYDENGPSNLSPYHMGNTGSAYGIDGFMVMLVANRVPHHGRFVPSEAEWQIVNQQRAQFKAQAQVGLDVKEALAYVKHPGWRWFAEP